jgi:hypothetical protein
MSSIGRPNPASSLTGSRVLRCVIFMLLLTPIGVNAVVAWEPGTWALNAPRKNDLRISKEDHGTHYFMSTSAIPLGRGNGWYKNSLVTLNSAAYGLTSGITVSGGIDLFSMFVRRTNGLWFSKLQLNGSVNEVVHMGIQGAYIALPLPATNNDPDLQRRGFATGLAMITIGTERNQLTLQGGMAHDGLDTSQPMLGAAGMLRIAPNVALVTEHWVFIDEQEHYPVHSLGVRILGDLLALDVGLVYDRELAAQIFVLGLPFIAGTLNF